ncbi:formylglycine-generating enzyme family protein [Sandaracinobacter neustonicus]|uniref:Formylglycine-generating enzyme family protein n=1 Tax=Sandaracinobacter neustonicus TaxID=1715348 RepID=A0A501XE76_9SPHN|nr:formylglycine-generating enzyme family protein [Sandaracinobacter neustonicus]TPE58835.1 formylglycine-generating enzyme family protein [Sandaracinobacter neustonicus]
MVWLPGGRFRMGSDRHYREEASAHEASVAGFLIDRAPVTNRQFAAFVAATGHVTLAEIAPDAQDYPDALPEMLVAASLVFTPTEGPVRLDNWSQWWRWVPGADWRHPTGPDSSIAGLEDHPVVQVAAADAEAYAAWAGKRLPTEAEWEYAGWGGNSGHEFAWGDVLEPEGRYLANVWQGEFPHGNSGADGYLRTSPVGSFPPNGFGLSDMIGNVWEWTADWYANAHSVPGRSCCAPENPRGAAEEDSHDPATPQIRIPRRVLKGGSHLCALSYCRRYRPAARHAQTIDSSTSHIGFRCVKDIRDPSKPAP